MFPQMNIVGVTGYEKRTDAEGQWVEPLDGNGVKPEDLYEAQLQRRLNKDQ